MSRSLVNYNKMPKNLKKNKDSNSNSNHDTAFNSDKLDEIIGGKKSKKQTHDFRGYYLELEVIEVIDRLTNDKGKGVKSELVNEILKDAFKRKGWMD